MTTSEVAQVLLPVVVAVGTSLADMKNQTQPVKIVRRFIPVAVTILTVLAHNEGTHENGGTGSKEMG